MFHTELYRVSGIPVFSSKVKVVEHKNLHSLASLLTGYSAGGSRVASADYILGLRHC